MSSITEAFFRNPPLGEHTDDLTPGLILVVRLAKTRRKRKSWILRVVINGKRRKIGFSCGLAEARRRAADARWAIREGNDPSATVQARQRASLRASEAIRSMTFAEAAAQWLPRAPKLRHPVSVAIRERALVVHLAPIRDKALIAITPAHIVEILVQLRPETALRVYSVAKAVIEFGAVALEAEDVNLRPPTELSKLRALGWSPRSQRSHKPLCNDLIEAMEVEVKPPRRIGRGPPVKRRSMQFLELLPVVKGDIDAMTADDIRKRWDDDDRRRVNQRRIDYETYAVFDLVQETGFTLDKPDRQTLELALRVFSYTGDKMVGISMVRKRLAAWKAPGKYTVYAFHKG